MEDLPGAMPMDQQRSLLQTAIITQLKYIKGDVYTAKDPSLNRDLSCHSDMKTKCVISLASWMLEKVYALCLKEICIFIYSYVT